MPSPTSMTVPTLTSEVSAAAPSNWVMRRLITSVISSAIAIYILSSALGLMLVALLIAGRLARSCRRCGRVWSLAVAQGCRSFAIVGATGAAANDLVAQERQFPAHTAIKQGIANLGDDPSQNFGVYPGLQGDPLAGQGL